MTSEPEPTSTLDPGLLEILRCPACLGEFAEPAPDSMTCRACGRRYPIRGGVPVLLVDEAELPEEPAADSADSTPEGGSAALAED